MINSIVLAEDNLEQCFFFKRALKQIAPSIELTIVNDGDKLMQLLESFHPQLLFLDLAMPCKDGMQCIREIREDKKYDSLPIVVYTLSAHNGAIQTAYAFGANLYFIKPQEYSQLVSSLDKILSMDWNNPKSVIQKHFYKNRYIPFQV